MSVPLNKSDKILKAFAEAMVINDATAKEQKHVFDRVEIWPGTKNMKPSEIGGNMFKLARHLLIQQQLSSKLYYLISILPFNPANAKYVASGFEVYQKLRRALSTGSEATDWMCIFYASPFDSLWQSDDIGDADKKKRSAAYIKVLNFMSHRIPILLAFANDASDKLSKAKDATEFHTHSSRLHVVEANNLLKLIYSDKATRDKFVAMLNPAYSPIH
jgi:hypothetical protein